MQVLAGTPLIDVASTTHQKNIPAEEFDVIPKGRSFQALATALPSVNSGRARRRLPGERRIGG